MAAQINIAAYSDALVVLGTAGVVVPLVQRWGLNPVLGYLAAGALLGPLGMGSFIDQVPLLYWFTVVDARNVASIADLGVVFLLFLIGLELSFERLKAMRRLVVGLGSLQIFITTTLIAGILIILGQTTAVAIMLGGCLAFSSTAIVLEILAKQSRLTSGVGRTSFAVLLAQDIAVVPVLMFVSVLGSKSGGSIFAVIGTALLQAIAAVGVIAVVGRIMLRPLLRLVAGTGSKELFIAAILFVIVATSVVAAAAELSMALGAFVAGLLLAETEYRKAIEATIEPFKGLLLGIFFFTVGMGIDARELAREPVGLMASVVALITLKTLVMIALARFYRLSWPVTVETALLLGPSGEFAFVAIGLARTLDVLPAATASFAIAVTSLTMALIPLLAVVGRRLAVHLEPTSTPDPRLADKPDPKERHAIVVGYGRVGQVVCGLLAEHRIAFTAVDLDPKAVAAERSRGKPVYYGDATDPEFLKICGLASASAVILTGHTRAQIDEVVRQVRTLNATIPIVSRALDADHARHLYGIGVTDAVPETIEASLQLSEAALVGLGVPTGLVIASIHAQRDVFRNALQEAARSAGHGSTRAIRAKA